MRRRPEQEREEADAREQAEARRLALLAELKAREVAARPADAPATPEVAADEAPTAVPEEETPVEPE